MANLTPNETALLAVQMILIDTVKALGEDGERLATLIEGAAQVFDANECADTRAYLATMALHARRGTGGPSAPMLSVILGGREE